MSEPGHRRGPFAMRESPQRARLRVAVIDLVLERGLEDLSVETICDRAAVDVDEFEREFGGVQDCALRIYLANIAEFDRVLDAVAAPEEPWRQRLRKSAYAAARHIRDHPRSTRFDMIAMLAAGELAQAHRDRYVRRLVGLIDEGRQELDDPEALSPAIAESVFGSIYQQLARELQRDGRPGRAEEVVPQLMYLAVRPYLGEEAAREELGIPPPPEAGSPGAAPES